MKIIKDRAKIVFQHFGFKEQVRKLDEEHGELTRKLGLLEEGFISPMNYIEYIADVSQELADNLFLLLQFIVGLDIKKEVYEQLDEKSKRTLERIQNNYYENKKQR